MLCCALGAVLAATAAAWTKRLALVLAAALGVLAVLAVGHVDHYAAHAAANERALLAEMLAQPICSGAPAADVKPGETDG